MQYLIHLDDCRKMAHYDVACNLTQLKEILEDMRTLVPTTTRIIGMQTFHDPETDSDYISTELENVGRKISVLKSEVKCNGGIISSRSITTV